MTTAPELATPSGAGGAREARQARGRREALTTIAVGCYGGGGSDGSEAASLITGGLISGIPVSGFSRLFAARLSVCGYRSHRARAGCRPVPGRAARRARPVVTRAARIGECGDAPRRPTLVGQDGPGRISWAVKLTPTSPRQTRGALHLIIGYCSEIGVYKRVKTVFFSRERLGNG